MNCPFHILIYKSRMRSYRELPLRLLRVRHGVPLREVGRGARPHARARHDAGRRAHLLHQGADGRRARVAAARSCSTCSRDFGLDDFYLELSTEAPRARRSAPTRSGTRPPRRCASAAEAMDLDLVLDEGGGAFYGPKISVQARDAIGRTWQMSTIQVDFQLPQRFELEYVGADNERHRPIMIHRALFGVDRAVLRHPRRALRRRVPAWLAPVQVTVLPVADRHDDVRARSSSTGCAADGFRAELVDAHADTLGARVRRAKLEKVPYVLVVGDDDVEHGTVGVNRAGASSPSAACRSTTSSPPRRRGRRPRRRLSARDPRPALGGVARHLHRRGRDEARRRRRRRVPVRAARGGRPRRRVRRSRATERAFAVMNAYPYTSGHLMVAPAPPRGDARGARPRDDARRADGADAGRDRRGAGGRTRPRASTSGSTSGGPPAPASPATCTCTSLPRWNGDTNFMTTVAEARVLPEPLRDELGEAPGGVAPVSVRHVSDEPTRPRRTSSPRISTSPRTSGPYLFPSMRRRRIPATMYASVARGVLLGRLGQRQRWPARRGRLPGARRRLPLRLRRGRSRSTRPRRS